MTSYAGQDVALYVNALDRTIQKNGVTKALTYNATSCPA
jgi:hypothetical protein